MCLQIDLRIFVANIPHILTKMASVDIFSHQKGLGMREVIKEIAEWVHSQRVMDHKGFYRVVQFDRSLSEWVN